jgi:hypothetical protein
MHSKKRVEVRVRPEVYEVLRRAAEAQGRTLPGYVGHMMLDRFLYLTGQKERKPPADLSIQPNWGSGPKADGHRSTVAESGDYTLDEEDAQA